MTLLDGRDLRVGDAAPSIDASGRAAAGVGIVNEAFARAYFDGQNPVGPFVDVGQAKDVSAPMEIVGYVRDAVYRDMREPMRPTIYLPMEPRPNAAFLVRTAGNPLALAPVLRQRLTAARPGFRIRTVLPQSDYVTWNMLRERLLAALSFFFAVVALVLAAVGLYGVLNHSVAGRRREIGICMALGARPAHVVRIVAGPAAAMACVGIVVGSAAGAAIGRMAQALLYEVTPADASVVAAPALVLFVAAILAALPPAARALRVDPAETLKSE
jgi:hypothetical protein